MILTYEQADRFYTLINALLGTQRALEVVRELPPIVVSNPNQGCLADAVG